MEGNRGAHANHAVEAITIGAPSEPSTAAAVDPNQGGALVKETLPHQRRVREFYASNRVQVVVAGFIAFNFCVTISEKSIDPVTNKADKEYFAVWYAFGVFFNMVFLFELIINLYGHWWCEFWKSDWNRFDFCVVMISVVDMLWSDLPKTLQLIRLLRAFRVFRLFARVEAMRKIIESLLKVIPGVCTLLLIFSIVLSIYSVFAVSFFSKIYDDCNGIPSAVTARGTCWGPAYYGTFFKGVYTMFQVLTGESWSEAAARPALNYYYDQHDHFNVGITYCFFYSFMLIASFMLLNVVVALLTDGILAPPEKAVEGDGGATVQESPEVVITKLKQQVEDQDKVLEGILTALKKAKTGGIIDFTI